jgi:hypothetical protein
MAKATLDGKAARMSDGVFTEAAKKKQPAESAKVIVVSPPKIHSASFLIVGNSPYVQHNFSEKARQMMHDQQEEGSVGRKGKKRDPKNFHANFEAAKYKDSKDGWLGIPCTQIKNGLVDACRYVDFKMTLGKGSLFVETDGYDTTSHSPLIRITKGDPIYHEMPVRNQSGVADLRARPMWLPGWEAVVRIKFDADRFSLTDVYNLLVRVGIQIGIGEGRPFSPKSCGLGWGTFEVAETAEETA